jgi:hypothetical protein
MDKGKPSSCKSSMADVLLQIGDGGNDKEKLMRKTNQQLFDSYKGYFKSRHSFTPAEEASYLAAKAAATNNNNTTSVAAASASTSVAAASSSSPQNESMSRTAATSIDKSVASTIDALSQHQKVAASASITTNDNSSSAPPVNQPANNNEGSTVFDLIMQECAKSQEGGPGNSPYKAGPGLHSKPPATNCQCF